MDDQLYISMAMDLAKKGAGLCSPNPLVGAVIVKNHEIIAVGHHKLYGGDHAEIDAFKNAKEDVNGATLYCNLEPCCHHNKQTPPCAPEIIKRGIKRVVISNFDPNPLVAGKGVALLREHGIEVTTDILVDRGLVLNEIFFHYMTTGRPFIHLKIAQTLDGKIADHQGNSQWISNSRARAKVHELRHTYDAVMVGAGTVIKDNPSLSVRDYQPIARQPQKIVVTHKKQLPTDLKIHHNSSPWLVSLDDDQQWEEFWQQTFEKKITSILVEGGSQLISQFLVKQQWQRISLFLAPKLLGNGLDSFLDKNRLLSESIELHNLEFEQIQDNILISGTRTK